MLLWFSDKLNLHQIATDSLLQHKTYILHWQLFKIIALKFQKSVQRNPQKMKPDRPGWEKKFN